MVNGSQLMLCSYPLFSSMMACQTVLSPWIAVCRVIMTIVCRCLSKCPGERPSAACVVLELKDMRACMEGGLNDT